MKKLLILPIFLLFTGCTWMVNDRIVLMPQTEQYPLFAIEEFSKAEKCEYDMWEERDINATYLVSYKEPSLKCLEENKDIRKNYNLLIKKVTDFNTKIKTQNKIQNEKKPYELK